jgi:DNA polymerase III epsilon subunit-like protein
VILFFDTETTGFLSNKLPRDDPGQPRIVQLAAILAGFDGTIHGQLCLLIQQLGQPIPQPAFDVHKKSTELCDRAGVDIQTALEMFFQLQTKAELLVAHNLNYDLGVVACEVARYGITPEVTNTFCTMLSTTDICRIPTARGYKWPKLVEAYRFFFQEDFSGAHDALADVRACMRIYFELQKRGLAPGEPK